MTDLDYTHVARFEVTFPLLSRAPELALARFEPTRAEGAEFRVRVLPVREDDEESEAREVRPSLSSLAYDAVVEGRVYYESSSAALGIARSDWTRVRVYRLRDNDLKPSAGSIRAFLFSVVNDVAREPGPHLEELRIRLVAAEGVARLRTLAREEDGA